MIDNVLNKILNCMAVTEIYPDIQKVQTEHRIKLVESMDIKEGDKVLEIGCGQGDTTAVLAHYVGDTGHVHGIDIASPTYGSPITVGESTRYLLDSELGSRISIDFEVDILTKDILIEEGYDVIVLSHCSWYFNSQEELLEVFKKIKKYGKKLCFAESNVSIVDMKQYAHLLAVMIQAQLEIFKKGSISNIRTLFTKNDIVELMKKSCWNVIQTESVYTKDLQDGKWEVDYVLNNVIDEVDKIDEIPIKMKNLLKSQYAMLENYKKEGMLSPLASFVLIAEQ